MRCEGGNVEWKGIRGNEEIWRKGEEKGEWGKKEGECVRERRKNENA